MSQNNITVQIECKGKYSSDVYSSCQHCYLATALKEAGFKQLFVGPLGRVEINGIRYVTKDPFNSAVLKRAFEKQKTLTVELERN